MSDTERDEGKRLSVSQEPEVEGHRYRPYGAPPETQGEQPGGEPEVEGHSSRWGEREQPGDADDTEGEVAGHFTSLLNPDLATNRTNERLDEADLARRANDSKSIRDGGMLDKIRRFTNRER